MVLDIDEIRKIYTEQRPLYDAFAQYVAKVIEQEIYKHGIKIISIKSRAKEVNSFIKKAFSEKYKSPIDEIRDKAGIRVVAVYFDDLEKISDLLHELFNVHSYDDKSEKLEANELGYLGIHLEVSLSVEKDYCVHPKEEFKDLVCEIQLHTQAQNLWAGISHELLYKPKDQELPQRLKRDIFRLIALIEIFDGEITNAKRTVSTTIHSKEVEIFLSLKQYFQKFTEKTFNQQLSYEIIGKLINAFDINEQSNVSSIISEFIEREKDKIQEIYNDYSDDERCNPLLFQPESLLIFERLQHNRFVLKEEWNKYFPSNLLESFGSIWGVTI